jgi:histidine triad (HIT) family protein
MSDGKTIFGRIIDREIPAKIVYEDDQVLAFHDVHPQAPVHVLIVPKKPIDRVENAAAEDTPLLGHMMWTATRIAKDLKLSDGYRLVMNNGENAGQSVFHIHLHLLAGRHFSWPPG